MSAAREPLHRWTLTAIRDAVHRGDVTAEAVLDAHAARIDAAEPRVDAFVSFTLDEARAAARAVDAKRARGERLGRLAGVPIGLKDNLVTTEGTTTCASRILAGYRAPYDAHVVERLRAEDALLVGKLNMDEFAMGSSTENSSVKPTRNPWDLERAPGGSSGGSAAATAAGLVAGALGSDTGGSVRQPGAFTGVAAIKPTYGRVSRYGLIAFASSLDQVGTFGRTVGDAAELLSVISGHDARDATSAGRAPFDAAPLAPDVRGLRVGVMRRAFAEGVEPAVRERCLSALDALARAGATLVDVDLPHADLAVAVYYVVATAEASSNLLRFDGVRFGHRAEAATLEDMYASTRGEGFGPEVKRRIMLGTYALASGYYDAYYLRAQQVRTLIRRDYAAAFEKVDLVATPTAPTTAFRLNEKSADPLSMYLADIFTVPPSLAGVPAVSVPVGLSDAGLPVGLQLTANHFDEASMLRAALTLEVAAGAPLFPPAFA